MKALPLILLLALCAVGCGSGEQEFAPGKGNPGKPPPAGVMQGGSPADVVPKP